MTRPCIPMIAAAAALALSGAAAAQVFSSGDFEAREQVITARHRAATTACALLDGHPHALCRAEADAEHNIAMSILEAQYRPSAKARHQALLVAAESRHAVAKVRCEERSGAARGTCLVAAQATRNEARDKARAQLDIAAGHARAREQSSDDREDASDDNFAARYQAARQQCSGYVGRLKERCLAQTREQFRQP